MKNLTKILMIALIAISASCSKTGPTGPAGADGTNGTNGTNGNANVTAYSYTNGGAGWVDVTSFTITFTATNLSDFIKAGGVVQLYMQRGGSTSTDWLWVPGYYYTSVNTLSFINNTDIAIYFKNAGDNTNATESTAQVMVVLIPATTKINAGKTRQLTLAETMKLYHPNIIKVN